ncbi:MAG: response regulator [Aminobacteriaceae bacterium]
MRVMIVDDAAFMRMLIRKCLTEAGHEVVAEAYEYFTAIEEFKKLQCFGKTPDVITMDITLPGMRSGIDITRDIRALSKEVRIVMTSAMGTQYMVIDAMKAGANDFVVKPFKPDQLVAAVEGRDKNEPKEPEKEKAPDWEYVPEEETADEAGHECVKKDGDSEAPQE